MEEDEIRILEHKKKTQNERKSGTERKKEICSGQEQVKR
jgi:hypothetical protein